MEAYLGAPESFDAVEITGSPALKMKIAGGVHGDIATASIVGQLDPEDPRGGARAAHHARHADAVVLRRRPVGWGWGQTPGSDPALRGLLESPAAPLEEQALSRDPEQPRRLFDAPVRAFERAAHHHLLEHLDRVGSG